MLALRMTTKRETLIEEAEEIEVTEVTGVTEIEEIEGIGMRK